MGSRADLHDILSAIPGVAAVYFQPPASVSLTYPCIIYDLTDISLKHADNLPYMSTNEYTLTLIDKNPDSSIKLEISKLRGIRFSRYFGSDGLNHYVFTLNY
jgi:hypothetical protein